MKKITYSIEVEVCGEVLTGHNVSKEVYVFEKERLFNQVKWSELDVTKTEFIEQDTLSTPFRDVEILTFARGSALVILEKTIWKGVQPNA